VLVVQISSVQFTRP